MGVLNFHSKKDNAVCQSMWAALTMYNFSMAIAGNVAVEQKDDKKHKYAVSISMEGRSHLLVQDSSIMTENRQPIRTAC